MLIPTSPDFLPASHQYLLAVVTVFWSFGQFFLSLVTTILFFIPYFVPHLIAGRLALDRQILLPHYSHHLL